MKRLIGVAILILAATAAFAQTDWVSVYEATLDLQQKARVIERMQRMGAEGEIWDVVTLDLYLRWNNLGNTLDRVAVEEALRTSLSNVRNNETSETGAIIYALARQTNNPHLKGEAILTLGHLQFDRAIPWLTNHLWHMSMGPGVDPLGDEIVASACVESLRMYRTSEAEAALSAASDIRAWFPDYIRESAQEGLMELAQLIDL